MEDAEGAAGPGAPAGPGLRRFGCASFNQDSTSLAVGTKSGYKLFSLTMVEKLDCIHESVETPDVYIVERLFSSSLVVVVSTATPQRMNIYHFKKGTEICNYSYPSDVLSVKLNRQRLIVCLEESIYIHNIKDMKLLKTLLNTPSNPSGLCALSINHSNSYLAYPGSATIGEIIVYDANNLNTVTMIPAHDSPVVALTFNASATKLASASERGTVIRVFSIPEGLRLFEFRRGMKRSTTILSFRIQKLPRLLVATASGQLFIYDVDAADGGECMLVQKHRLFGADDDQSDKPDIEGSNDTEPIFPSYAATAALPASGPVTATLTGYSEDGGAKKGEVIPEHEFAAGPVCLDDENEFPPINWCRDRTGGGPGRRS
ncbi:WD repeat domain phosphoinositide-interacting protein 1-like [Cynoglossus semilaevis]|uniref:WD repeat domain phosphoinositide-interacting protein 1-like n=1 Tax=Cynoglossus semilaevis TaxID=244447 RepID=UPI000D62AA24|nr:WD repeat domain phosphoinositide-interacting protein 1-like [Cynoglossus semilaevis]